ncbi:DHA2 family efflux MFS transporter permease subunit [Pleomorphomonas carboxyditropha]|uniref:MFS transporter n=1 Tax=Pleomorphomonas carboxyditropha TaxID=2023338 RepID=A0A2G9WRD5_9HYPH|nr:DHA2 family efflux MFS transporter permease subunit [Pleomorphomonas carboxyditropha]PIO97277.1 MFS transporter [Pleomorphomonas carboxyditropha]
MAAFLGSMEYVLEEGPSKDWLDDERIALLTGIMVIGGIVFFVRAFTRKNPVVDLWAFKNRNFAFGSAFSFCLGIGLYGLTYLYPLYLARVRGFSALQIGETMFVSGVAMLLTAPIAGRLSSKLDPRVMMGIGFAGIAVATWLSTGFTADWDFWELFWPQIFRGVFMMICMIPINNIALGTLPPAEMKNASGLFNLTRNLGGAVGLALINQIMTNRSDLHFDRLRDAVNITSSTAMSTISGMEHTLSGLGSNAHLAAISRLTGLAQQQSTIMAFNDIFDLLTVLFLVLVIALPFVKKPAAQGGGGGGH